MGRSGGPRPLTRPSVSRYAPIVAGSKCWMLLELSSSMLRSLRAPPRAGEAFYHYMIYGHLVLVVSSRVATY